MFDIEQVLQSKQCKTRHLFIRFRLDRRISRAEKNMQIQI